MMAATERQLWEIAENLCRADLTELERGEHLLRRKELYEWWHPETKAGGLPGAPGGGKAKMAEIASFAVDTAEKTGIADRTIRQSIARAKKIDDKVRDRIRDNPEIADSGVELDALAAMAPTEQKRAVALVEAGQAAGIRDARPPLLLFDNLQQTRLPPVKMAADTKRCVSQKGDCHAGANRPRPR